MANPLTYLFRDPPPLMLFEVTESVLTVVRVDGAGNMLAKASNPLPPETLVPSAQEPNIHDREAFDAVLLQSIEEVGLPNRPDVALFLPDAAARLSVLEFDGLPNKADERLELLRARLRRSVPFEIDEAHVSYQVQQVGGKSLVLVAVTAHEILRQYEEPFQEAGFWPGFVSVASAQALNLMPDGPMTLLAKVSGRSMTLAAGHNGTIEMVRSVDLVSNSEADELTALREMTADLYPTSVYVAENLGQPVSKLLLCGFDQLTQMALQYLPEELDCPVESLRNTHGPLPAGEAGIWGYLQTA